MIAGPLNAVNPGPVFQAGTAPSIEAGQTTLPSMRGTLAGWFKPMIVGVVTFAIAKGGDRDGQSVPTTREVRTSGVLVADEEEMSVKPGGDRTLGRWVLHVYPQLNVPTDTRITIKGVPYTVMARRNFTANGYIRYKLTEDFASA